MRRKVFDVYAVPAVLVLIAAGSAAVIAVEMYLNLRNSAHGVLTRMGSDVHKFWGEPGFTDFDLYLSAKITPDDFDDFAARFNLLPVSPTHPISGTGISWGDCPEPWWPDNLSLVSARFHHNIDKEEFAVATFHDGRVYYRLFGW